MKCPFKFKGGSVPDRKFSRKQLLLGVKEEKEHTGNVACAKAIAKGHLIENPVYYSMLSKLKHGGGK